ncbi:hypothetical protein ABM58_003530 [Salmonella enterica subsp. enterica]|nr:hypothetical protein [Salmonella enterica subsp. enterica serovar Utah]ECC3379987.1 hypothetical protein [Salmonella enterica subsp. enterica serovar Manchester]ECR0565032.1 hypothetical protein [Salmonella enterica]EDG5393768.1 hypothetical protein [Salmonella enterica subsp. enterica serovar Bovismorbificans]OZU56603.1 hypothetical protein CCO34_19000 [Salmonella enterica subsp. enterica serovar Hadar]
MKNNGLFFSLSTFCHSDSKPALFNAGFVYVVMAVWYCRVVAGLFFIEIKNYLTFILSVLFCDPCFRNSHYYLVVILLLVFNMEFI